MYQALLLAIDKNYVFSKMSIWMSTTDKNDKQLTYQRYHKHVPYNNYRTYLDITNNEKQQINVRSSM